MEMLNYLFDQDMHVKDFFLMLNCINYENQDFCKMDRIYLLEKAWMEVSGSPALVCINLFLCFSFLYTCGYLLLTFPCFNLSHFYKVGLDKCVWNLFL